MQAPQKQQAQWDVKCVLDTPRWRCTSPQAASQSRGVARQNDIADSELRAELSARDAEARADAAVTPYEEVVRAQTCAREEAARAACLQERVEALEAQTTEHQRRQAHEEREAKEREAADEFMACVRMKRLPVYLPSTY